MAEDERAAITRLQEIFGVTVTEAENAYCYYNKSLGNAIDGLSSQREKADTFLDQSIAQHSREDGDGSSAAAVTTCSPNPSTGLSDTGTTNSNPIDLTQESQDDDLQKALALSLQDMQQQNGGISLEDQELSKALEASIADTQTNSELYGTAPAFVDPLNPHERKRLAETPVGLKNIGNTCWFSAVIQSLFNIPVFRYSIVNFKPGDSHELPICVLFVLELQKLFALLLQSNQKYINPKPAIDLLKTIFQSMGNQQQDVSEFTHKLLEWIEDAFAFAQDQTQPNPMVKLFTGQCVTEGVLNDKPFVNHSQFGAFPVQIEGHTNLHDSLEAATVNTEMEQETWFTRLPPVLVLELSRFKYNQMTGQAEKIHDQLSFDKTLYIDRYLHGNREESRKLRTEMSFLREKMKKIEKNLKSYTDYKGKGISINDVLSLASQFTGCHGNAAGIETKGLAPRSGTDEEVSLVSKWLQQWRSEMDTELSELQTNLAATQDTLDLVYSGSSMTKTAYSLHAVLVHQGQAQRGHYWAYVKSKADRSKACQVAISQGLTQGEETKKEREGSDNERGSGADMDVDMTTDLDTEFSSPLSSEPGGPHPLTPPTSHVAQSSSGTMETVSTEVPVFSSDVWLKYNDVSVTEVDWNEVRRESFGGSNTNTSAYCLVYISTDAEKQWQQTVPSQLLSSSLEKYVIEHNMNFDYEIKLYDLKQKTATEAGKELIKPAKSVRFVSPDNGTTTADGQDMEAALASDAKRARAESPLSEDMQIDMDNLPPVDPLLVTQLDAKVKQKYQQMSRELPTVTEPRLVTVFHYASICQFSEKVLHAILLDMVIHETKKGSLNLSMLARKDFYTLCKEAQIYEELKLVRHLYQQFCSTCYHFVQSINEINKDNWYVALAHSVQCFELNSRLCKEVGTDYSLEPAMLGQLRSKALLRASELGTRTFTSGEISSGLVIGNDYIVPSLKAFSQTPFPGDEAVLERVREDWCQCLDQSTLTEDDSDKLADLLVKIVDDHSKAPNIKLPQAPINIDTQRLAAQFTGAHQILTTRILSEQS